jgi:fucose 4-O-acetylase-like acetyltransferase
MPNTRIYYIDVAKGLLILMVVLPHMSQVADLYNIHNKGFELIRISSRSWVGYYMPAFFLITGMCSNFTQTFKAFLLKNLKTLMLPSFTLMALCVWIENILNGSLDIRDYLSVGFSSFLKCGGLYWFITALFIAKILYWVIVNRVSSRFYR